MSTVEDLLQKTAQRLAQRQRLPESTYRLQFHAGFTFRDACAIVPYLSELGITHCYASPYLKARAGSTHGYDIIDHGPQPRDRHGGGIRCVGRRPARPGDGPDPRHRAQPHGVVGNENAWWNDVLENGPASPYAAYFDIAWQDSPRPELRKASCCRSWPSRTARSWRPGRSAWPSLTGPSRSITSTTGSPSRPTAMRRSCDQPGRAATHPGPDVAALHEYQSILTAVSNLPDHTETDPDKVAESQREKEVIKRRLAALAQKCAVVRDFLEQNVALFNGTAGEPHSFDLLERLLDEQATAWRTGGSPPTRSTTAASSTSMTWPP